MGLIPGLDKICGLSLLLVLFSAMRGFSRGILVFPFPQHFQIPIIVSRFQWMNTHFVEVPLQIPILLY